MNKPVCVITSPLMTRSGYGDWALALAKSLLKYDKYDVRVVPTRWGQCPQRNLEMEGKDPLTKELLSRLLQGPLTRQPELFIQVSIPNEFLQTPQGIMKIGKYNIGITAAIETTIPKPEWLEGLNRMDLNIVMSQHGKDVFAGAQYSKKLPTGVTEPLIVKTPIEVLFWGANTNLYHKTNAVIDSLETAMSGITENFAFLFVGQWTGGSMNSDRKSIGWLMKTFLETFKGVKNPPALILKTSGATLSNIDRYECLTKIKEVTDMVKKENSTITNWPNIYLLHGELSDIEMNSLYNHKKVKVHVSFTHGEGYCTLEDTPIVTKTGLKNIKNVTNKDMVLTHTGQWKKVTASLSRHYSGEMKKISVYNGINSISYQFTPNHRCYVYRNNVLQWISTEELKLSDYLALPEEHTWTTPPAINISEFIQCPNIELRDENLTYIHSNETTIKKIKNNIVLSPEFAKICGYFLSEGCVSNGAIIFSLNKNEELTIAKELIECFKTVFEIDSYSLEPHKTKNSLKLIFYSAIIGEFLTALFGSGAIYKRIPMILKNSSKIFVENLISSIFMGDGSLKNNKNISLQLVNDSLIRDVRECLLKLNIHSCHDVKDNNKFNAPVSRIRTSNYKSNTALIDILNKNHSFCNIQYQNDKYLSRGGLPKSFSVSYDNVAYHVFKLKTIESLPYEGMVYNLSVEEDESYCTENFVVHNCHPMLLSTLSGKPLIAPKWSGHLDFMNPKYANFFEGKLEQISGEAVNEWFVAESQWFTVDYGKAAEQMRQAFNNYDTLLPNAELLRAENAEKFSIEAMDKAFHSLLEKYVPKFVLPQQIILPKLKKLNLPKLPTASTPINPPTQAEIAKMPISENKNYENKLFNNITQ